MAQPRVEMVLLKQLASCLAMPMFVVNADGDMVFFNESLEPLLGRRFDETDELGRDELPAALRMTDESGGPIGGDDRPVVAALARREPVHRRLRIEGLDGRPHRIEGTGIPLIALDGELLGGLGLLWEIGSARSQAELHIGPREVEVILIRRLAEHLAVPIFIVDPQGHALYLNEAAEPIVGGTTAEVEAMTTDELYEALRPTDAEGSPLKREEHPLAIARIRLEPAHQRLWIRGFDGVEHDIEATAIPLIGQSGRALGAVAFFWELGTR
jgi:PAS domain S-box-containing protein